MMSLRARLVLIVAGLLTAGLTVALGATAGALIDTRQTQNHRVLTSAAEHLRDVLVDPRTPVAQGAGIATVWSELATEGDLPSFFQVRDADGQVLWTTGPGPRPEISRLPDEVFSTAGSVGGGPRWLLRTEPLGSGSEILVIGMQTGRTDELIARTARIALVTGVLTLLAVAGLSWYGVRRGLRPLDEIADTAVRIGSGDLTARVPPGSPGTELGRLGSALNGMLVQLDTSFAERIASEQRLRRFVADASHELRTPLASIRGYAELFRRGAADRPDDLATAMRRIESESERMSVLVDELLLLARLDHGVELEREPVDLVRLACDAVTDALAIDPGRPISLESPEELLVTGDEDRLRQVLVNLLSNVVRHTPRGTPARVSLRAYDGNAVVEVADEGKGLTPDERDRALDRFYRAKDSRPRGGSGLGLSIVAAVVEAHGGRTTIESEIGHGTTVTLTLPAGP